MVNKDFQLLYLIFCCVVWIWHNVAETWFVSTSDLCNLQSCRN